jgi:4-hydroxybenzoate polyprenyltransferase
MAGVKDYAALMRLDKPIGIWLVFFPAAWAVLLASPRLDLPLLLLMLAGAVIVRGAGCILNDLADRELDRQVARTRTRPLASGAVTVRQALALLILLGLAALSLLLALPGTVLWPALLAVPMIAAYPWMKRITWWPQLFLGLTFNLGALIGWLATGAALTAPAWLLYSACIFWTLGYDTIYALQDLEDDARAGIKSSARRLGASITLFVSLCYATMLLLLHLATMLAERPMAASLGLVALHMIWQLRQLRRHGAARAGALFRSNQWLGFILMLILALDRVFT